MLGNKVNIISRLQDYNLKQDFQYFAGPRSSFKFGFNSIFHRIIPGAITFNTDKSTGELKLDDKNALENAVYGSHELKVTELFTVEYGLRVSAFSAMGPGNFYSYDEDGNATDTAAYKTGDFVKTYVNLEPRIGASYILNEVSSVKASYGRNTQNLHLLSNSTSGSPTDLWIPSSINVKPEIADQISLGYFRNLKENKY
ncbi:MAG: TonB-dependent receptor, partial [Chitinophagaceae bacterium]